MSELNWEGKYKDGKRQGPVRIALPFQTIETVNESAKDRQRALELFAAGRQTEWRNRLIWGDKKYVLPSLLPEFSGKVRLIYIDPPFDTGADFSFVATIPDRMDVDNEEDSSFTKEPSILEQKAYRDTWGRGLDSYLQWFYETLVLLRECLAEDGSIYVHLDWHVGHYAKAVLDDVFGSDNFRNEIVWYYPHMTPAQRHLGRKHDTVLWYTKGESYTFNLDEIREPYDEKTIKRYEKPVVFPGGYEAKMHEKGKIPDDVWRIPPVRNVSSEKVDFPTQKPEVLLDRIIKASSTVDDLVADVFCGSGTTAVVAEKLGRRWIACDLSRFAVHTIRKRLLDTPGVRPFVVQNLGKYERQAWQVAEFPANGESRLVEQLQREAAYRAFILDLYHATAVSGNPWLHGAKGGRMVHVGSVDAPVTLADVKAIARETWKAIGVNKGAPTKAGVDILGWEFAFELNEVAKQAAAESRIEVAFRKIPREVLDRRAVDQGDVRFFELGALSVIAKQKGREAMLKLTDFVIPTDDIPEEARKAIKHWSQLIDYWAVDWDFKGDTFHNQWQTYRTRKEPKIELETKHTYPEPGKHTIVAKVIDILGNDTTKTLEVKVE